MGEFHLSSHSPEEALQQSLERFGVARIALASSFGAEDQVLTDMLLRSQSCSENLYARYRQNVSGNLRHDAAIGRALPQFV